jgi:endonuclease YncB( thermonuclease family)
MEAPGMRLAIILATLSLASPAMADECKMPRAHERFEGVVTNVVDGDTIRLRTVNCSALQVRFADFDSPERNEPGGSHATATLTMLVLGRPVQCRSAKGRTGNYRSYGRAMAQCFVGAVSLGDQMRAAGVMEGGR